MIKSQTKRFLFLSIAFNFFLLVIILASTVATTTAATQILESAMTQTELSFGKNAMENNDPPSTRRRLGQSLGTTPTTTTSGDDDAVNDPNDLNNLHDSDDDDDPRNNPTSFSSSSSSSTNNNNNGTNMVFTPMGECELCPHNWRISIERDDEKIKGEYESCVKYGRRRQFECTVLYQAENGSSEKIARNLREYRSCRFTEQDEIYRILRMQIICILVGMWSMRNVLRQRVVSASLFDQRRMRLHQQSSSAAAHNNNNSNNNGFNTKSNHSKKYETSLQSQDSMETVELIPMNGRGKVPKSPAPDPNFQTV